MTREGCNIIEKARRTYTFMYLHQRQGACRYDTIAFKQENIPQSQHSEERQLRGQGRGRTW